MMAIIIAMNVLFAICIFCGKSVCVCVLVSSVAAPAATNKIQMGNLLRNINIYILIEAGIQYAVE